MLKCLPVLRVQSQHKTSKQELSSACGLVRFTSWLCYMAFCLKLFTGASVPWSVKGAYEQCQFHDKVIWGPRKKPGL